MLNKIKANGHIVLMIMAPVALIGFLFNQSGESQKALSSNQSSIIISDIITQPSLGWAVVYWTTNVQTTGRVEYGKSESYDYVADEGSGASVKHRAYLQGIGEGTYNFRIIATDPKTGKSTSSSNQTVTAYLAIDSGDPAKVGCKKETRVPEDYRHIGAAVNATCLGGTVYVGPGEYREDVVTWGGVSLIGAGASKTTIRGPGIGFDGWGSVVHLVSVALDHNRDGNIDEYIVPTLSGFTITSDYVQRTGTIDNAYAMSGSTGVTVASGPGKKITTIKNNVFKNLDMGIMLIQYNEPAAIVNNTFIGGKDQDYGILINIGGGTPYYDYLSTLVENNAIVEYEKAGVWVICPGVCDFLQPTDFTIQYNNTWRNTRDFLFTENTIPYRPWQTLNAPVFWQNYFGTKLPTGKTQYDPTAKNGNISADPLFINARAGDYHERVGSPHVDAGNPKSDFSLEPQPNGGRVNIGTYGNTTEATLSR